MLTQHDVERLFTIVRNLRSRGAAIIYISHRLDEIFALADRVTVLRDGQWVATQKATDITEAELIRQMVGRALEEEPIVHDVPRRDHGEGGKSPILRIRNLKREPLLSDASLSLHTGEIVGLAGLIGSGRSELAQAIFGTLPPESGTIELEGRVVSIRGPEDAIRLGIAYVPEDRGRQGLVTAMNVGQNVSLTQLQQLTRGPFLDYKAEKLLAEGYVERLRIKTPNVRETVRNLSGGNQQKIVIAKWLATNRGS